MPPCCKCTHFFTLCMRLPFSICVPLILCSLAASTFTFPVFIEIVYWFGRACASLLVHLLSLYSNCFGERTPCVALTLQSSHNYTTFKCNLFLQIEIIQINVDVSYQSVNQPLLPSKQTNKTQMERAFICKRILRDFDVKINAHRED